MQWVCDSCGGSINEAREGWLEWLNREENGRRVNLSPRIVHIRPASPAQQGCQYNQRAEFQRGQYNVNDLSLTEVTGDDGLMTLLGFVSEGYFEKEQALEIIKRLHVPDYDLVRRHFDAAIGEGVFEPNTKPGYYGVDDIQAVKRWLERQE
ncbi:hypothetical protein D3C77_261940 [compost metagenome]